MLRKDLKFLMAVILVFFFLIDRFRKKAAASRLSRESNEARAGNRNPDEALGPSSDGSGEGR